MKNAKGFVPEKRGLQFLFDGMFVPVVFLLEVPQMSLNLWKCIIFLGGSMKKAQKTQDHMNITHFAVNDHLDFKVSA